MNESVYSGKLCIMLLKNGKRSGFSIQMMKNASVWVIIN